MIEKLIIFFYENLNELLFKIVFVLFILVILWVLLLKYEILLIIWFWLLSKWLSEGIIFVGI